MVNTVAEAEAYGRDHPTRDGGSWGGWCASLVWRSLNDPYAPSAESAEAAGDASDIVSTDPHAAPRGAFHFWHLGSDGHVGSDLDGGGTRIMMASSYLLDIWGEEIGTPMSYAQYADAGNGAQYRGWSRDYIGTKYADGGSTPQPKEDDPMPTRTAHVDDRKRSLSAGTWSNLYVDDSNDTSFVHGKCVASVTVWVQLTGLKPGDAAQLRIVTTKYGSNDIRSGTTAREIIGTSGTTYAGITDSIKLTKSDDGARVQIVAPYAGVSVLRTEIVALVWAD